MTDDVSILALTTSAFLLLAVARVSLRRADRRWALRERVRRWAATARLVVRAMRAIATGKADHTNPLLLRLAESVWHAAEVEAMRRALYWKPPK